MSRTHSKIGFDLISEGEASETVSFVSFNAPIGAIMEVMEKCFGKQPTSDKLQQEFFQLQQDKGE